MDTTSFLEAVYVAHGGLVERDGHVLTALAPPESGLPEQAEVWAGPPESRPPGAELLHPGHPLLDAGIQRALQGGQVGLRHVVTGSSKRAGLDDLARRTFGFRNARLQLRDPLPATLPWATFHFHVTFLWDEKREDLVSIPLDLHTGARVDLARLEKAWLDPGGAPGADRRGLERGLELARRHLERELAPRRQALESQAARHAEVEESRLATYYGGLLADLAKRLRSAAPERVAGLQAKHAQAEAEWAARRAEARDKYRLRVRARLSCLELVDVPRVLLPGTLTSGKTQREVTLSYSLLTHEFDPLACDGCLGGTKVAWLCEDGHLACPGCRVECGACGRPACRACPGTDCACGARLCGGCGECVAECQRKASSSERPAAPAARAAKPAAKPPARAAAPRAVVLVRELFADQLPRFNDLPERLEPILRLVEERKFRAAGSEFSHLEMTTKEDFPDLRERFQRVGSCLRSADPAEAVARLEKLHTRLKPILTAPPIDCRCCYCQAVALLRRRLPELKAGPELVEQICRFLEQRRARVEASSCDPAGWAAAAAYLNSKNTQADCARWFGVSTTVVSHRARELRA